MVPCYFQDNAVNDPGAPTVSPNSHRIKWSHVTKGTVTTILVASEGKVHVETEYLDRVTMVNYPLVPTDVTLEITELRAKDSGTYRCEVLHGIEDNYDTVDVQVQGSLQALCFPEHQDVRVFLGQFSIYVSHRYCVPLSSHLHPLHPDI